LTLILRKPVIAITGSAGKTTTKEMIASILKQRWKIYKTSGNANAPRHTAVYARKIKPYHKAVVLEFGMSHHGQIKLHTRIIQPNIGIVTNVGTAHIGNFKGNIKGIANTKSDLIRNMKQTGLLVLNADDKNSRLLDTKKFKGKIMTVSQHQAADYQADNIEYTLGGMKFRTKIKDKPIEFKIPVYGRHNIYNALFAIAVADYLGFSPNEIRKGLLTYKRPGRRLTIYRLKKKIKIIDDTFSANPHATKAAIDVLSNIGKGTNVAVLGTMLEMGKYAVKGHKDVGKFVAKRKIDYLYTYGKTARLIGLGAREAGFPAKKIHHFSNQRILTKKLIKHLKPNTTFLFKASHGMELNKTVKALVTYHKSHSS